MPLQARFCSPHAAAGEFAIGITPLDNKTNTLAEEQNCTIIYPEDGIPYVPEGVAVFANSTNGDAAVEFLNWLYSSDDHLKKLAEIDGKDTVKAVKPNIEGLELTFDTSTLMKEDLSLFGSERDAILEKWDALAGAKYMTVLENVIYGLRFQKLSKKEAQAEGLKYLSIVGLEGYENAAIQNISGGQQQRVALARALIVRPKMILMDEPLSNLDAGLRVHIREELRDLQRKLGMTIVFVTHDQEEACHPLI